MATIIIKNIPDDLYKCFKVKCAEDGISIKAALINLMGGAIKGKNKKV